MKTTGTKNWTAVCVATLTAAGTLQALADQAATTVRPEKNYTGTVASVDPKEHTLDVKGFVFSKKINLGDTCAYVLLDNNSSTVNDLRPGEKVRVRYQDAGGVLVADRVEQEPMRYEGMVTAVDPEKHTLTVHVRGMDKTFQIAEGCGIMLRNDKSGMLADIQVGNHVTVTYETPHDTLTARQIAQTSAMFTGTLTAIDLDERTVKAKTLFGTKKFNLTDNCAIVINGKTGGQLSDLRPNDKLVFSYDEINGINVVNRIAPTEVQANSVASTAGP
jgi:mannose-6-phosphate isomerase-like protein (cupin superfamily)